MYQTNGQSQAPQTNGQVPYMAAPAGAPSAAPVQQMAGQPQMLPAQPPAVPQPQIGGGYSGPQLPQYGFNQTPAPPPVMTQPQQQQQPWPPQLPGTQPQPSPQVPQVPVQQPGGQQQQQPAGPPQDLAALIRAQGFEDPNHLIQRLPQLQALAQYGAQALAQQQGQQQPAAAQSQQQQPAWNPPPYDPNWERFLDVDERTGRFVAADPALMHYASAANQYRDWQQAQARQFWNNPYEFTYSGLRPKLETELIKPLQDKVAQLEQYIEQQQIWDAIAPYERSLYAADQQGNLNYNQLTAQGSVFNNALRASAAFTANGRPLSVEDRVRYALGQMQQAASAYQPAGYQPAPQQPAGYLPAQQYQQPQMMQPPVQYQATPPAINPAMAAHMQQQFAGQNPQDSFLNRALERAQQAAPQPYQYQPGMSGSLVTSAESGIAQSPAQNFEALAHQTARELGITL